VTASDSTTVSFTPVAGCHTSRLTQALLAAPADNVNPSQNPFAILDSVNDHVPRAADAANDDTAGGDDTAPNVTSGNNDTDDGSTLWEDGNSQTLLDTVTEAKGDLQSTLNAFNEKDIALDTAICGIFDNTDDNDTVEDDAAQMTTHDAVIDGSQSTIAPTMELMMVLLQNNAMMQEEILLCLNTMDYNNKKNTGRLRVAINSTADSTVIARLDLRLEKMASTVRNEINNTIGTQLNTATKTIMDLKVNLTHLTKVQAASDAATNDRLASLATQYDTRFTAFKQRLSSPLTPRDKNVVDPSIQGCNGSPSQFPSTPPPDGTVEISPISNDLDDIVEIVGNVLTAPATGDKVDIVGNVPPGDKVDIVGNVPPPPHASPLTVHIHSPPATIRKSIDPAGVPTNDSTFTLSSGHFGSGIGGGPTKHIAPPLWDQQVPMHTRRIWLVPQALTFVLRLPTLHPKQFPGHPILPLPHTPPWHT
jgi:hypothetical protein